MIDKPRLIDADKLLKWIGDITKGLLPIGAHGFGIKQALNKLKLKIESGVFDPDPPQQEPYIGYRKGEPVRHKTRKLYEAKFEKWSKSGKRIGVKHNYGYPFGVSIAVDYFDPRNIEKVEGEEV